MENENLIPCQDGTYASKDIGCVNLPGGITNTDGNILYIGMKFANHFLSFVISLSIVFIIYGGITYALASGSEEKIDKSKKIIFWSVLGLIVGLLAKYIAVSVINIL